MLAKSDKKIKFHRRLLFSEMIGVFLFQMILIVFIIMNSLDNFTKDPTPPSVVTAFARFLTGLIMQIMMSHEISEGLNKMKFALNHTWKIKAPSLAWLAGFLQTFSAMAVVIVNYFAILQNDEVIEIVMNFLALQVIAEFDNLFFTAHSNENFIKQICINENDTFTPLITI